MGYVDSPLTANNNLLKTPAMPLETLTASWIMIVI